MSAFPAIDLSVLRQTIDDESTSKASETETAQANPHDSPNWTSLRKAAPYNKLLSSTLRWADGLPGEVKPLALMAKYPRLANMAAASWDPESAFRDYLDHLLVDRRGGRKGFSPDVLADLERLRAFRFHGFRATKSDPSPVLKERLDDPDWTSLRKAAPYNKLLNSTQRWADDLPPEIRPHALMAKYPRIANIVAASWEPQTVFRDCLDLLLVDHRGGRKGFPPEILAELKGLRNHHLYGVTQVKSDPSFYKTIGKE